MAPPSCPGLVALRSQLLAERPDASSATPAPGEPLRALLDSSVDPLRLWAAAHSDEFVCFWETADESFAGLGIRRGHVAGTHTDTGRRFGALPFAPGWGEEWLPLAGVGIVPPRWTLTRSVADDSVELILRLEPDEYRDPTRALRQLDRIEMALSPGRAPGPAPGAGPGAGREPAPTSPADDRERESWRRRVRSALDEIAAGRFRKTVLARRLAVELPDGLDASMILDRLRSEGAGRFRFGMQLGSVAFIGASPECLFRKRGRQVDVEALAGTFDLDRGPSDLVRAAEYLFASGKDLEEHALVVRGIVDALTPLSDSVTADEWPSVREARRLAHLSTNVSATLRAEVDVPAIIDALHPTPAVGGLPREPAVEFLLRDEPDARGLFAAPIGWVDDAGDACFAVGIRSALVRGRTAVAFAGAGIVAGSDPDAEWRETAAKLRWLPELTGA